MQRLLVAEHVALNAPKAPGKSQEHQENLKSIRDTSRISISRYASRSVDILSRHALAVSVPLVPLSLHSEGGAHNIRSVGD
jgi:hypothetical protein